MPVLLEALADELLFAQGQHIVFAALQEHFPADEFFLVQAGVLFVGTQLALAVHVEGDLLGAVVEPVLLHGDLCVSQEVLLFGQFGFGI